MAHVVPGRVTRPPLRNFDKDLRQLCADLRSIAQKTARKGLGFVFCAIFCILTWGL